MTLYLTTPIKWLGEHLWFYLTFIISLISQIIIKSTYPRILVTIPACVLYGKLACDKKGYISICKVYIPMEVLFLSEYILNWLRGIYLRGYYLNLNKGYDLRYFDIARIGRDGVYPEMVVYLARFISSVDVNILSIQLDAAVDYAKRKAKKYNKSYNSIKLLPTKNVVKDKVGVIDIETVKLGDKLYPYAVGIAYLKGGVTFVETFYIVPGDNIDLEARSSELVNNVCEFIKSNLSGYTIYAHNLGKFDGYLLLKPFYKYFGSYDLLVDKSHSIISITLPGEILFKDSLRVLPLSLKKLGNLFETEHRKLEFDTVNVSVDDLNDMCFREELLKYLHNDLLCLLEVLTKASKIMLDKFNVDLYDCYSISSLAFIIFRTNYIMQDEIPTLPLWLDKIIRESYRGGSVDVYEVFGKEAYYYDINSLYPFGICNDMPYKYLGKVNKPDLKTFFGFAFANIYVPEGVNVPLVPIKSESGSLFYPTGHLKGLFFSEELKMFISQGYKVQTLYGYEFSKADLFSKYVLDLYHLKATTDGSMQKLVKLLLNGLYGYFGRDPNVITAKFITFEDSKNLGKTNHVYDEILMSDGIYLTLYNELPDENLCTQNGLSYKDELKKYKVKNPIKTNVAISSAITSYSRVIISFFKTLPNNKLLYSDTDSVFLMLRLDPKYISENVLGMMKDVLKGGVITEYLFLEPKLYYYKTLDDQVVIKARGVKEGVMSIEDMMRLHRGETVNYEFTRLYKSFSDISITEKTIKYTLTRTFDRKTPIYDSKGVLIAYKPLHIPFKNSSD